MFSIKMDDKNTCDFCENHFDCCIRVFRIKTLHERWLKYTFQLCESCEVKCQETNNEMLLPYVTMDIDLNFGIVKE